jgi:hypothetical protein
MACRSDAALHRERVLLGVAAALAVVGVGAPVPRALAEEHERAGAVRDPWRMTSLSFGVGDDFFSLGTSRLRDDDGFTASLRLTAELSDGDREKLHINVSQQMITERGGVDRVDEGRVYASWERFLGASAMNGTTIGWTLGVGIIGNLGGSQLQDWAHRALFTGRLLSGLGASGLQHQYPSRYDVLALAGGAVERVHPLFGGWSLKGGLEALVGVGTGAWAEMHPFVALALTTQYVALELRQGAGIYETNIRPLTMRGGYVTGVLQSQPSVRLTLAGPRWLRSFVSLEWDLNHGDSHQHVGEVLVGGRF